MANVIQKDVLENGARNAHIKLTGVLDTTDISWTPAVSVDDFPPIPGAERDGKLIGFRIDHVTYSIGEQLEMLLSYNGNSPEQIAPLANRAGRLDFAHFGGITPDQTNPGFDGNINLASTGYMTDKQNFTITLEMVKLYRP